MMKRILLLTFLTAFSLVAISQKTAPDLPINFNDTANVDYTVIDFGGDSSLMAPDPNNASNLTIKTIKPTNAQTWAGVVIGNDSLENPIPFSIGNTIMRAVVYAPDTGIVIRLKVEDETNGTISVETDAITTVAGGWDTLTFDFSNHVSGTPAINFNNTYDKIAIFYNFGVVPTTAETYYLDYVEFFSSGLSPITLPINWDDTTTVDYTVIDFGGNSSALAADPNNPNNNVLKSTKTTGAQIWAGTTFGAALGTPVPFSSGYTTVRAVVYSPDTGIVVKLKVEDQTNPALSVETDVTTTVANAWDTLAFDFSNHSSGTPAINFANTYDKMSIFYDFGVMGANKDYYVDYVEYVPAPALLPIDLPITWDDPTVNYSTVDFGGNSSMLGVSPTDTTNSVLVSTKTTGAQVWAGTSLGNSLANAIPFTAGFTTVRAVVYSPDTGIVVKLKVEDKNNGALSVETDVTTTVANAWDTLSFDFANNSSGTPAINFSTTYDKMSIFYDFGVMGSNKVYYLDYVEYVGAPPLLPIDLPITWDDTTTVDYTTIDFGGNSSMLAADPTNASNNVLRSEKTTGAQIWAGVSFGNNLGSAIPFSTGNTTITAVVYSPDTGIVVKLKVEDQTNPTISVETDVTTTVANAWQALTFDFANQSSGTSAINFANTYDKMSIFYDFGTMGSGKIYYVDRVEFGSTITGIEENTIFGNLDIYPNPARDRIVILAETNSTELIQAEIYNSTGKLVYNAQLNSNVRNEIDLSGLSNGFYMVVVKSDEKQSSSKLLIAR